jgi:ATP-dependent RNA helicase DeaD
MLKTIQRATNQPIAVEQLPTIADLRARRLELTRAALRESLLEDDLERFRGAVEPLAEEFDVLQVALAAVKLAHEATGAAAAADEILEAGVRPDGEPHRRRAVAGGDRRRGRVAADGSTRLFVGAGRSAGVRPQDLVGAIAGESRLSGRDIGAIEIADRYSLVEVPESAADEVIAALRASTIKGRKPTIRRERNQPR